MQKGQLTLTTLLLGVVHHLLASINKESSF